MRTYRKKSLEVQAAQWLGGEDEANRLVSWVNDNNGKSYLVREVIGTRFSATLPLHIRIEAISGLRIVCVEDWVVLDDNRKFEVYSNDQFNRIFHVVNRRGDFVPPYDN